MYLSLVGLRLSTYNIWQLTYLEKAGIRLKKDKCAFMLPLVEYLDHTISAKGSHPKTEKIRAITAVPTVTNVSQLKSFLGLINYYSKFLPKLSHVLAPLYQLLQNKYFELKKLVGLPPQLELLA